MRTILAMLVVVGLAAGGVYYYLGHFRGDARTDFRTETIRRGDLLSTISASGTLEPEEVVDVGAQVVGRIKQLGLDPDDPKQKKTVDYGSTVHEGMVLAMIDDATYRAELRQVQAQLERSKADLLQLMAKLEQTKQEWKRAEVLRPKNAISDTDFDLAVANYKSAEANVAVGQSVIRQNEAALELAQANVNYTVIKSPVDGKIIDRRVNIGQTVVSSLNAPSLFLIAKDLRRMQIWASVNEADIGRIRVDMPVSFTVDAFPGKTFRGHVSQIRLNATMVQNVVTYTVVVAVDNSENRLLPYMTANLQFEVERRKDVLLASNMALRWKPKPEQIAADVASTASTKNRPKTDQESAKRPDDAGRLWVEDDGGVHPIDVVLGLTDGQKTEISGPNVKEGLEIVLGEQLKDTSNDTPTNPFVPQLRRSRSRPH
ncbi:MAG: efflux RND transporter periplasmic adaptor subunit [Planctomycetaceae bacterium]|nr:efflux RND transporter periplasmic adaptor subunit [Planctomycetaceae bacterium]